MVPSKKFEQLESTSADAKMILIAKGGGPNGAIVFYTVRSNGGEEIFDLLDDEGTIITTITKADIKAMWLEKKGAK